MALTLWNRATGNRRMARSRGAMLIKIGYQYFDIVLVIGDDADPSRSPGDSKESRVIIDLDGTILDGPPPTAR